ncbi:hypothetical protein J6590_044471 [Homalodisca vitripennis]|nr:hypothetical protein J6590_044471 [Homalodisca vitripennis]
MTLSSARLSLGRLGDHEAADQAWGGIGWQSQVNVWVADVGGHMTVWPGRRMNVNVNVGGGRSERGFYKTCAVHPRCVSLYRFTGGSCHIAAGIPLKPGPTQSALLIGLYLSFEPTIGHSKNRCVTEISATLWMSRSGTSLTTNVKVLGCKGNSIVLEVLASFNKGVNPLPALTGEAGSELASPSSGGT